MALARLVTVTWGGSEGKDVRDGTQWPSTNTMRFQTEPPMMCWSSASVATRTGGSGARSSKAACAMGAMSVYFHASLPRRAVGNPTSSNFAMADCRSA